MKFFIRDTDSDIIPPVLPSKMIILTVQSSKED